MYPLEITISGLPKMTNTSRVHWRIIHLERKKWKNLVKLALGEAGFFRAALEPLTRAKLTLTRHSSVRPDSDGLVSSFKGIVDSLVECGVIIDDNYGVIGMPHWRWERAVKGAGFVTIKIEEDKDE